MAYTCCTHIFIKIQIFGLNNGGQYSYSYITKILYSSSRFYIATIIMKLCKQQMFLINDIIVVICEVSTIMIFNFDNW